MLRQFGAPTVADLQYEPTIKDGRRSWQDKDCATVVRRVPEKIGVRHLVVAGLRGSSYSAVSNRVSGPPAQSCGDESGHEPGGVRPGVIAGQGIA